MPPAPPAEIRQLESILQSTLIPLAESGSPLIWLGVPPRSPLPIPITSEHATELEEVPLVVGFKPARHWIKERVNSVEVPVIGCVLEGRVDYLVRTPPGQLGRRWTVPVQRQQIFFITPGTPVSDGSDPQTQIPDARGILIFLQRDGISCLRFTIDKNKLARRPYILLYEPDARMAGEQLLRELERDPGHPSAIAHHYLSVIFLLMSRAIKNAHFTTARISRHGSLANTDIIPDSPPKPRDLVRVAAEYIDYNLNSPELNLQKVSLHTGLSVGHLNRIFQSERGVTPYQYLQAQRLEKARHLLLHSNLQIRQVASLAGFKDQAHFAHWFTRHEGCSPMDFRGKLRR